MKELKSEYKWLRENFPIMLEALEALSCEGNNASQKNAIQFRAAASRISFTILLRDIVTIPIESQMK